MTWLRIAMLLLGLGLLVWVFQQTDLSQVGSALASLGVGGALAVVGVFLLAFVVDTLSWQRAVPSSAFIWRWLYGLWKVRMVGEALNISLPTTVAGEPLKAVLLRRHFAISYQEGAASLIIAKTVNLFAFLVFAAFGLAAMVALDVLSPTSQGLAFTGFAALTLGIAGFFAVQRWRVASRIAHLLARWRLTRPLDALLTQIDAVEGYFQDFYVRRRGRFAAALALAFLNWCLGMVEVWMVMAFLGHPVSLSEALMMSALVELVRAGTFFIPGSLGATELTFVLIVEALTGQAALGLAVSLVRRARELLWIAWGLGLGWSFSASPLPALAELESGKSDRR